MWSNFWLTLDINPRARPAGVLKLQWPPPHSAQVSDRLQGDTSTLHHPKKLKQQYKEQKGPKLDTDSKSTSLQDAAFYSAPTPLNIHLTQITKYVKGAPNRYTLWGTLSSERISTDFGRLLNQKSWCECALHRYQKEFQILNNNSQ